MSEAATAPETVTMQVRSRLRELALPLREQLEEIDKRLVRLNRERDDLLEARREIVKTIANLEPSQVKANGAGKLAKVGYEKKKKAVQDYIRANAAKLSEGFTASELNRMMRDDPNTPLTSPTVTLKVVRELHSAGIVRADSIVRGGAQLYVPIGK